jgi:hypothetical protein
MTATGSSVHDIVVACWTPFASTTTIGTVSAPPAVDTVSSCWPFGSISIVVAGGGGRPSHSGSSRPTMKLCTSLRHVRCFLGADGSTLGSFSRSLLARPTSQGKLSAASGLSPPSRIPCRKSSFWIIAQHNAAARNIIPYLSDAISCAGAALSGTRSGRNLAQKKLRRSALFV